MSFPHGRKSSVDPTWPMLWLLMTWRRQEPGHQQAGFWASSAWSRNCWHFSQPWNYPWSCTWPQDLTWSCPLLSLPEYISLWHSWAAARRQCLSLTYQHLQKYLINGKGMVRNSMILRHASINILSMKIGLLEISWFPDMLIQMFWQWKLGCVKSHDLSTCYYWWFYH